MKNKISSNLLLPEFKQILKGIVALFFPPTCLLCRKALGIDYIDEEIHGLCVCPDCKKDISLLKDPFCSLCSTPFKSRIAYSHVCGLCELKRPHFDLLVSPFIYEGGIERIITDFKYSSGKEGISLGNVIGMFLMKRYEFDGSEILIPVPLHKKRERERGFNQTLLLAEGVREVLGIKLLESILVRKIYTKSQTGLSLKEREANVRGVFELNSKGEVRDKVVLLIDDVATTGSTLNECSKVLKKAGAKKVICAVLARAYIKTIL